MPSRVLLGKSTNSNLGHSGGKFGLFISATGRDVTNCTKEQLSFSTDHIGNSGGAIDVGHFQVVPMLDTNSNPVTVINFSTTAGQNKAYSNSNLGAGSVLFGTVTTIASGESSGTLAGNAPAGATGGVANNAALVDSDESTVTNSTVSGTLALVKGFSTDALF